MCGKFIVSIVEGCQESTTMVSSLINHYEKIQAKVGWWHGLHNEQKWLALNQAKISMEELMGKLVKKCKYAIGTLEWQEKKRYFEHSSTHWSLWLSNQGLGLESTFLIEVKKINNKCIVHLRDLWDEMGCHFKTLRQKGFRFTE